MNYLIILLLVIAIVITVSWNREHMSNEDVITTLKTYGVDTNDNEKSKKKKNGPPSESIYGPKSTISKDPQPNLTDSSKNKGEYPHIYGPDVPLVPGKKVQTQDGGTDDSEYDYNIDLAKAFPRAEGPPQPFLTNFSSFQR
jgi:hypothetical protein